MGLEVIEQLKRQKGITTKELSEMSGVPVGTLNKILNGETKDPKLETLIALKNVLGCTLDDFDTGDDGYSVEEQTIITKYRQLDNHGKKIVNLVLDEEKARCAEENKVIDFSLERGSGRLIARNGHDLTEGDKKEIIDIANRWLKGV